MFEPIGNHLEDGRYLRLLTRMCAIIAVLPFAARTRLLDHLDDGPKSIADLSTVTGFDSGQLARAVSFLAAEQLVDMLDDGRIGANARTKLFQQSAGATIWGTSTAYASFPKLEVSMRKGTTAWDDHFGRPIFEFIRDEPGMMEAFTSAMTGSTEHDNEEVFRLHAFRPFDIAVDVGGSHGVLLMTLLGKFPNARGILFDLPETIASASDTIANSGMANRIEAVSGDFFKAVPAGADLYLLKQVLHDWSDEQSVAILSSIRKAIRDDGRVAVLDQILPDEHRPNEPIEMDICMLLGTTGRERHIAEFEALFGKSGFKLDRVSENPSGVSVIEAVPV